MVYSNIHKLLTVSGGLFTGTLERWSFGIRWLNAGAHVPPDQTMVNACAAPFATFFDSAITIGQYHSMDTLKLASIDTNGKYPVGHIPSVFTWSPAEFPPGTTGVGLPSQVSMAASLTTNLPRGLAHMGRIYLPPTGMAVGSDGRWTTSQATGAANAVKVLINALAGITGMGAPVVMSDVGAGAEQQIRGVRVGRVPDTVRRRRRSLVEGYQSVTLV